MSDTHSIEHYIEVQSATHPSWAGDGRSIAFLMDSSGTPQVWRVSFDPGCEHPCRPDQLTHHPDRVMDLRCSPTGDYLVYTRDMGGNENAQIFLVGPDRTEKCLSSGFENARHILVNWSLDGESILYASNRRDPQVFDLFLQPINAEPVQVWRNDLPGLIHSASFSPDCRRIVAIHWINSFDHLLIEIDLQTSQVRQLLEGDRPIAFQSAFYSADGQHLYVLTNQGSEYFYILRHDLVTRQNERLVTLNWDVECMVGAADGKYLVYGVNEAGVSRLFCLNLDSGEKRSTPNWPPSPGVIARLDGRLAFSPDSKLVLFSFSSAVRSSDIYCWNLVDESVCPITRVSHAGIPLEDFKAPDLVHFPTFDTAPTGTVRQIPAWFYRGVGSTGQARPVVIIVHGGPEYQARPHFDFLIQYLVHFGYSVLVPNVRGSTGYGTSYSHLDDGRKRMDAVADLAHAAQWLKNQPYIDCNRVAVLGASYGGFMVLAAMTTYPDLWAAGVNLVGISNFVTFLERTSPFRRAAREAEYGSLSEDRDFLTNISPVTHAANISRPLMVIHGANDPRVPLSETRQLAESMNRNDVAMELLVFDDEGHGIVKQKNKKIAYPRIVDFLDRHLSNNQV